MNTPYDIILNALADKDYNDGGMMAWHPSGTPTDQAEKLAARIVRELKGHFQESSL